MKESARPVVGVLLLLGLAAFAGCGGGGGDDDEAPVTSTGAWTFESGTDSGAAPESETVVLFERNGQVFGTTAGGAKITGQSAGGRMTLTASRSTSLYWTYTFTWTAGGLSGTRRSSLSPEDLRVRAQRQNDNIVWGVTGVWVFYDWAGLPIHATLVQNQGEQVVRGYTIAGDSVYGSVMPSGEIGITIGDRTPGLFVLATPNGNTLRGTLNRTDTWESRPITVTRLPSGSSGDGGNGDGGPPITPPPAANWQGTVAGTWSGTFLGRPVSGNFEMTIRADNSVSISYSGSSDGSTSGSVSASGQLTGTGGGSGAVSWTGTFRRPGTCSGTWSASSASGTWSGSYR